MLSIGLELKTYPAGQEEEHDPLHQAALDFRGQSEEVDILGEDPVEDRMAEEADLYWSQVLVPVKKIIIYKI